MAFVNPSGANTGIFREISVNTFAAEYWFLASDNVSTWRKAMFMLYCQYHTYVVGPLIH